MWDAFWTSFAGEEFAASQQVAVPTQDHRDRAPEVSAFGAFGKDDTAEEEVDSEDDPEAAAVVAKEKAKARVNLVLQDAEKAAGEAKDQINALQTEVAKFKTGAPEVMGFE